ncbi:MAG TPA: hypothetical protein D7H74_05770 [Candidatus Poseidoniales archaeon]|nr:MAG TPA: hypothetical protein D7H74_05770 [Candidatus Poseidoniales archaeon]
MIRFEGRAVHISASPGAGKTTLCLGVVSNIILNGGRAIWACRKIPDPDRFREILHDIDEQGLMSISILNFSTDFAGNLDFILTRAKDFGRDDVVIVDDWCESNGRARKDDVNAANKLSLIARETNLIITSSSYEDASGFSDSGWLTRGGTQIESSYETFLLLKHPKKDGLRIISGKDILILARMTSKGLEELVI